MSGPDCCPATGFLLKAMTQPMSSWSITGKASRLAMSGKRPAPGFSWKRSVQDRHLADRVFVFGEERSHLAIINGAKAASP